MELRTIREMLWMLDSQTIAGQRHLMGKLVAFLGAQIEKATQVGARNRRMLLEQLALLTGEANRPCPSVPAFGRRAEGLLTMLVETDACPWNATC